MEQLTPADDDELSLLLRNVQVRSTVFCRSYLSPPWGFRVDQTPVTKFHLVLGGSAWLTTAGQEPVRLRPGDLALLVGGAAHTLQSALTADTPALEEVLLKQPVDATGTMHYSTVSAVHVAAPANPAADTTTDRSAEPAITQLLCGGLDLDHGLAALAALPVPPVLVLNRAAPAILAWTEPLLAMLRDEADAKALGGTAIMAKLADVFLTQALRTYLNRTATTLRVPNGHPAVATAVGLIRDHPEYPWTIDALAGQVGMSRSAFTTAFRAATDTSPITYLTRIRMALAAGHLLTSSHTLDTIAHRVGYDSRASLTKAFTRHYGMTPARYRHDPSPHPPITHPYP